MLLIDPSYELKADYLHVLAAVREALDLFADGTIIVWSPQLQLLESTQLLDRLKPSAKAKAKKGWLHARLTVASADSRGIPHSLFERATPSLD